MASAAVAAPSRLTNLRVLVAEDDSEVAQSLELYLQLFGCRVDVARDGPQALERAVTGRYDFILLDLGLPSIGGIEVCKGLRLKQVLTPIVMLTARASDSDKAIGLGAGADDYVTKPFSWLELQARLAALMRRALDYGAPHRAGLASGEVTIDVERRAVTNAGRPVELTAREFDLLVALASHPGRVYTREQLLDAVWGYSHDGYGRTVNSHINRLRAKLERDPAHPDYVLTVWSVGYKFRDR